MTMSDEMKSKMEELANDKAGELGDDRCCFWTADNACQAGFTAAHDLMAEELEKVKAERDEWKQAAIKHGMKQLENQGKFNIECLESAAWKEQSEALAEALGLSINAYGKGNFMDNEYAKETLTAFNEFKSLQSGNKEPESAQETSESDRTVTKEREE